MFHLSGQDNGLYFFFGRTDVKRCAVCRSLTNKWDESLASLPIASEPKYDVSYSYDGVLVVTSRFKDAVDSAGLSGMLFRPLQRRLFAARPREVVPFDAVRRGTRFENRSESCGQYESVVG